MITNTQLKKYLLEILTVLGFLGVADFSRADMIILKSGRVVEGEIIDVTDYGITVVNENHEEYIMYSFIRNVAPSAAETTPNSKYLQQLMLQFPSKSQKVTKRVQFYMAPWCPHCRNMEQFLISSGIPYEKLDIEQSSMARKGYESLGKGGIPVLIINGTMVRGYQPDQVRLLWEQWQTE